jgi:hypothetical protein
MLVYEVIVVLIPILKWIACCDASVIILCRCTISTFALVILTPIFCFVNACHEPTIFLIPSGKWIVCCIACAVAPCKCAITTFTSTAIFCFWPHWLVKIAWFYVFPLNWEGLWSFAFCPYMVGYQLKWLLVQSEGGSISNLLVNVSSFNFYLFCKVRFGWHPLALLSASFSVYVYQGMQSLKLKDTQLQTWCPNGCQCFLLLFLCLVPMQPIRHSINLQLRFESYFQLTNWSSWRYFWALGWTGWPLSAQGRLDPRGKLCCLWCPKKTWTPPLGASETLTIVENRLETRKLWPLKVKGTKNSKKQIIEHYKGWFLNTQKNLCMLFCYY